MWAFLITERKEIPLQTNRIQHYLSRDGIRLTVADTSGAAAEAEAIHHLPRLSASILSKAMTGAAILANDFKNHEGVSFKWVTGSPLGNIHVDAYDGHFVRGYLDHPEAGAGLDCTPENEAALSSEHGQLFVTRYSLLKMPYTSTVNFSRGEISAGLTEYLNTSEQTLSAVSLTLRMDASGQVTRSAGFLAQLMPQGDIGKFADYFRDVSRWDLTAEAGAPDSLESLLAQGGFDLLEEAPLTFRCTCSEERIRSTLTTLPPAEQKDLLKEPSIEIVCHYCGKTYTIRREVLKKWFEEEKKGVQ